MKQRLLRLGVALSGGFVALALALAVPILNRVAIPFVPVAAKFDPLLIAYTFAQTAPSSVSEMTTEVTTFATTLMPSWLVYVVFALIAALGIWIIARAVSSMKRG